jgi:hypothetical protein
MKDFSVASQMSQSQASMASSFIRDVSWDDLNNNDVTSDRTLVQEVEEIEVIEIKPASNIGEGVDGRGKWKTENNGHGGRSRTFLAAERPDGGGCLNRTFDLSRKGVPLNRTFRLRDGLQENSPVSLPGTLVCSSNKVVFYSGHTLTDFFPCEPWTVRNLDSYRIKTFGIRLGSATML